MHRFIHLSLSGLLALFVITTTGCEDQPNAAVTPTTTPHSEHDHDDDGHDHVEDGHDHDTGPHDGHDHGGGDHGEHAHGGEDQHKQTYDEAVTELLVMHKTIADGFAADNVDVAHGPLHNVGRVLEKTEALVESSDMDDDTKKKLQEAIEQLFASYGAVDEKMHNQDGGKDYSDVAEQIEVAMGTLKAQAKTAKE